MTFMKKIFLLLFFIPILAAAQKLPSIADKTKGMEKHEGFLNFYIDQENGKIYLEINKLDSEMLYQTSLPKVSAQMKILPIQHT